VADPQALPQVAAALSQHATIGRLRQVCDRWIYSACLCFGLDATEQARSGFGYEYSVSQVEYSRNLLFKVGGQMDRVFNTLVDRTHSRLDVPTLRRLFGAKQHPRRDGSPDLSPRLAVVIETPRWDLTWSKVHFGLLSLKATPRANTCCAWRRPCTTPDSWAAAGHWGSSPRLSPGLRA
jgi:hypothetical protein